MRKIVFFTILCYFWLTPAIYAGEAWTQKLSLDLKMDYVGKYMWRGFDLLDNDPAIQANLNLSFGSTGFYMGTWGNYALDAEWRKWDEIDFYAGYNHSFWEKDWNAVDMDITYTYFYFPRQIRYIDTHEIAVALKYPRIIPPLGSSHLAPYTTLYHGRSVLGDPKEGLWIKLGLGWDIPIPAALPDQKKQSLNIYVETFHNDGAQGLNVHPGWSHLATGMSTILQVLGFDFTPAINYQWSWEDTVNKENEFWFTVGISYHFPRNSQPEYFKKYE